MFCCREPVLLVLCAVTAPFIPPLDLDQAYPLTFIMIFNAFKVNVAVLLGSIIKTSFPNYLSIHLPLERGVEVHINPTGQVTCSFSNLYCCVVMPTRLR